jgi:hypothetical protein
MPRANWKVVLLPSDYPRPIDDLIERMSFALQSGPGGRSSRPRPDCRRIKHRRRRIISAQRKLKYRTPRNVWGDPQPAFMGSMIARQIAAPSPCPQISS